eukprot:353716-Chlamydomonas_euryale.AAC.6
MAGCFIKTLRRSSHGQLKDWVQAQPRTHGVHKPSCIQASHSRYPGFIWCHHNLLSQPASRCLPIVIAH